MWIVLLIVVLVDRLLRSTGIVIYRRNVDFALHCVNIEEDDDAVHVRGIRGKHFTKIIPVEPAQALPCNPFCFILLCCFGFMKVVWNIKDVQNVF